MKVNDWVHVKNVGMSTPVLDVAQVLWFDDSLVEFEFVASYQTVRPIEDVEVITDETLIAACVAFEQAYDNLQELIEERYPD